MRVGVRLPAILAFAVTAVAAVARAADWYQWRGPDRSGMVPDSPPLLDEFPPGGLRQLWKSEKILGGEEGGYGSVAVADGKAFLYSNWKYAIPIATRTVTQPTLERLGWSSDMPEELRAKVEEVRLSDERAKLDPRQARGWVNEWLKANLSKEQERFRGACQIRLVAGKDAVPLEVLARLQAIKDKEFASQADLQDWFQANGVEERWRTAIVKLIPTTKPAAFDRLFCLDASTGQTIWQVELPGRHYVYCCSSTPCVVAGRCYVEGSDAYVYCFDARTGRPIWKNRSKVNPAAYVASSFVVQDAVAVLLAGSLTGFDADTGEILWTQPKVTGDYASAAYWRTNGRTYLVCNGAKETFCFEAKTGKILWSVPGGGWSTPAISGDFMALYASNPAVGISAYRLNLEKPQKLWAMPSTDRGASPVVHEGHVYVVGGLNKARAMCIQLESGKVTWDVPLPNTEIASPVVADGKILVVVGTSLYMIKADPEKYELLGKADLHVVTCTSPALVDGKAYLRLNDSVSCYDLTKAALSFPGRAAW